MLQHTFLYESIFAEEVEKNEATVRFQNKPSVIGIYIFGNNFLS